MPRKIRHPFDDDELVQELDAANAEWLDGRTCWVDLDQELAAWLVAAAKHTPFSAAELDPYIEALPIRSASPITIRALD